MIFDGIAFKRTRGIVTMPFDWVEVNHPETKNYARFGKVCKENAKGAVKTSWSVGGEPVYAKPLPILNHSTTNMAYAGGGDMGKLYLVQGGVIYTAKRDITISQVARQLEATFTNKNHIVKGEQPESYLTDETVVVAYSKEQSIVTLVRHIHGSADVKVKNLNINEHSSSFAETKKLLKAMGDLEMLPTEEKAAKAKKLADKIFSTGKVADMVFNATTEIADFEPLFKDMVTKSFTSYSLNMTFGDVPFDVEFNGFVLGDGSYQSDSVIYADKIFPPQN